MGAAARPAADAVTLEELRALWREAPPVTDDPDVCAYLAALGVDAGRLAERDEARTLPAELPEWASRWREGWRLIVPMYAAGDLDPLEGGALGVAALVALWTGEEPPAEAAFLTPAPVPAGAVLANARARLALGFDLPAPAVGFAEAEVVEGPLPWLVRAPRTRAVVGLLEAGALPAAVARRLPPGALVSVRATAAAAIRDTLTPRCRPLVFDGPPPTAEELAAVAAGLPLELAGAVLRWTGARWLADDDAAAAGRVPPDTRWFALVPEEGRRASKAWRWGSDGFELAAGFDAGTWFDVRPVDVREGVEGLADLFARLAADPGVFLVHGIPTRAPGPRGWRRVVRTPPAPAPPGAWFAPHPIGRRGVIFDVDDAPSPTWLPEAPTAEELERAAREVVEAHLPRYFHGAAFAYQWSSSAGVVKAEEPDAKPWRESLSLHLGFWLERTVYAAALFEWAKTWPTAVDPRVALAGQPIFTAAPDFEGAPDPLEVAGLARTGLVAGAPVVKLPKSFADRNARVLPLADGPTWHAHHAAEARAARIEAAARVGRGTVALALDPHANRLETRAARYAEAALRKAVDRLLSTGHGGRHHQALREATDVARFADFLPGGEARIREELLAAFVTVAGGSRRDEGGRTITTGMDNAPRLPLEELAGKFAENNR